MLRIVIGISLAALGAARLGATVVVPADFSELVHEASFIVRGRVVAAEGRWMDARRGVETIVALEVEGPLKGDPGGTLYFRVPGGQLGRYRSIVVGAPEFRVGERVIVFLGGRAPTVPHLLGFHQGVFRVVASGDGWVVTPPVDRRSPSAAQGRVVRGDPARVPVPLSEFERQVRALSGGER